MSLLIMSALLLTQATFWFPHMWKNRVPYSSTVFRATDNGNKDRSSRDALPLSLKNQSEADVTVTMFLVAAVRAF